MKRKHKCGLTRGFSLVTRFLIFSSRRRRPGSRGPLPNNRDWSDAAAASSFSSSRMSKYFLMLSRREPFNFLSSFSRTISSSCNARSSSVCSSRNCRQAHVNIHSCGIQTVSKRREIFSFLFSNHEIVPEFDDLISGVFDENTHPFSLQLEHPF